ncbi:DUF1343 domain-containing protein [Myxococcota bacterium]|nr:DUF1343 domain-containing protein [Myxococcota bacterium]MBU1537887.1 DUF1343 domain-containing protein [Myxococcota bacterium]
MPTVSEGIDRFLADPRAFLNGGPMGVLAHGASCDRNFTHVVDGMLQAGLPLTSIFSPEHGLFGAAQDMEGVHSSSYRGLPVISLYGDSVESLSPNAAHLQDLKWLVIDLRDVGSRYYTYVWTALMAARQALSAGCKVLMLDRVNILGGETMEGNLVKEGFFSFVGYRSVPVRHALTGAELVGVFLRAEEGLSLTDFHVVPVQGWDRSLWFDQCGMPFILPSPNMPTLDTAVVYPGMCLLEGTNLSEGRGTTRPFEIFGAPFVNGDQLVKELGDVDGAVLRPLVFKPTFQKWAGEVCGGAQIHVTSRDRFRSWEFALRIVATVARLWPTEFAWREKAYEFVRDVPAFDLLCGDPRYREYIEAGKDLSALLEEDSVPRADWFDQVADSLLY